jgi:hypothetical protein
LIGYCWAAHLESDLSWVVRSGDDARVSGRFITLLGVLVAAEPSSDGERPGTELIRAQVQALDSPALAPGQRGELSLVLLEAPDRDMPLAVRLDAGALELLDNRLGWTQVVDPLALQPRLRATFRAPEQPGEYEVRASVEYWVCGERWCRRKLGALRWSVIVEAPA